MKNERHLESWESQKERTLGDNRARGLLHQYFSLCQRHTFFPSFVTLKKLFVCVPKDKSAGCHGCFFANQRNQESGDGHHTALRHSPRGLNDDKVLVGDVRWTVSSHIRSHVGHHVAKTVEATHGKLQKKSAQKWKDAENGDFGAGDRGCQCKCHL